MSAQIAAHDWASTPLGARHTWPQTLQTAVRIMLASRYSMFLWWGEHLINIYNDAYIPHLGERHPDALGRSARDVWREIWDVVGPQTEIVTRQGSSTWNEELLLVMERNGFTEETYFTFGYSPVTDDANEICGLLGIVTDETARVLSRRRLKTLRDLGDRTSVQGKTAEDAVHAAAQALKENPSDIPFALVYLLSVDGRTAKLAETVRIEPGAGASPVEIAIGSAGDVWNLGRVLERHETAVIEDLSGKCGRIVAGVWPEPVERAVVLPLAKAGVQDSTAGFLVVGISSRLLFDGEYRGFMDLTAGHIATAIANARAYDDERRRAEGLAQIDRAKTAFFANVSHEFRTPLTLMLGPLENVLAKDDALAPEDRGQLVTAHRNSLRLLKLVNSLLDFSRIEAGRIKASYAPVDLAALTTDLASNFRSAMEAAGLALVIDCPPLPEAAYVDPEMWEKIVLNLLSNAFKFTFKGSVAVNLAADQNQAVLKIADTGTGIPANELPRIFERFHRVEGARGRTFEGSGIGLALIQELVKLHGGAVEAQSRFGEGSEFTVRIPLGKAHLPPDRVVPGSPDRPLTAVRVDAFTEEAMTWVGKEQLTHPAPAVSSPDARVRRRPRILLADDNADMREHVFHILGADYDVTAVNDGLAALKQALHTPPDLVLADVMMPGLDGFELLRKLRAEPRTRELPVILLSARAGEDARTEGINAGADDYLTKPFAARELTARVETRLNLERLRREVRAQFETLVNQAPLGILLVDAELRIRQLNPIALAALSDVSKILGRNLTEVMRLFWPRPYADELVRRFRTTLETGEPYSVPEMAQERRDLGTTKYFEWRIDRMPLPEGRFGVVCYFRDITAQVEARNAIARSEERFRAFVTASSDVVYRMSPDWREMRQLSGRDFVADAWDPTPGWLEKYIHPDDRAYVLGAIDEAIRTKSVFELEHRVVRADGSLGWTFSRAVPLLGDDGSIVEWLGAAQDVTVPKLAAERVREAAERLRFMAESMPQKIFTAQPDGAMDYFNRQWIEYTGLQFEQICGWGWTRFIHPEEVEENVREWRLSIDTGEPFMFTHRVRRADGVYRWHLTRAHAMRDQDGKITLWIGSTTEIHDQKLTEQELRRANQALEQFAYSASHDLQEPLRSVKIYSELLANECRDLLAGEALEYLDYVRAGASRMEALVRDLLAYTQASLLDRPVEPVDANECLEVALTNLAGAVAESGAFISSDPLPSLRAHATHLQQLFQNLVGNAIKYRRSDAPAVIHISARELEGSWRISIRDNGIGFESEFKERIFGLFKRLHTSDEYSGTGIGLAICRRIVEYYHGRIWVESEPGQGSTFYFTLPV